MSLINLLAAYYVTGILICIATPVITKHAAAVLEGARSSPWKHILALLVLAPLWPLVLYLLIGHFRSNTAHPPVQTEQDAMRHLIQNNLGQALSISEIEKLEVITDPAHMCPTEPFGFFNVRWEELKKSHQDGDELKSFSFSHDRGVYQGYALMRCASVISHIFT